MIDAYEIGIQLLLQEDVSAGLAVINRGLAEVDRAIAVTSADLGGLAREADATTKAIATAVSGRAALSGGTGQKPSASSEQTAPAQVGGNAAVAAPVAASEKAGAPEMKLADPSMLGSTQAVSPLREEQDLRQQETREPTTLSSAPAKSAADGVTKSEQSPARLPAEIVATTSAAPVQVVPTAPGPLDTDGAVARDDASVGSVARHTAASSPSRVAVTASVARTERGMAPDTAAPRTRDSSSWRYGAQRERAVAPWSGVDQLGPQAEMTRLHERAAAPQSTSRDRNESGGGTVMLDGRLVGQWLSEHMAQEASRPPGGTSFFDPRQTPAWTVSGAL